MKGVNFLKLIKTSLIFLLCLFLPLSASADSDKQLSWCFKSKHDGSRPEILDGNAAASDYGALFMGPQGDKTVYLTFDAGYSNESVERILDILEQQQVKGAFFILPGIVKNSPETVKRMVSDGHLVCNHSTSHKNMAKINDLESFKGELEGIEECYRKLTGEEMAKYFRPPEGVYSEKTLSFCKDLGYTPVFWSFAHADWDNKRQPNPQKALENIINSAHDGMVLLLHPTSQTNAAIMEDLITGLRDKGHSFGTLDELKSKTAR